MVLVDMQIAINLHRDVDQRMLGKLLNHMVQKTNSRRHVIAAGAVEIHLDQDAGFRSFSFNSPGAHNPTCDLCVAAISAYRKCTSIAAARYNLATNVDCSLTEAARIAMKYSDMNEETPDSLIPYDEIVQEALRAVVGRVLGEIVAGGSELPGEHHFYITFKTTAAGVNIPAQLRERFPDEMTIVLQNKFWELEVRDDGFAVGLSFNQIPAKLDIPFSAITAFVDPAVDFGLQFQATSDDMPPEEHEDAENDAQERDGDPPVDDASDGSNVVTVDFGRKK